MARQQPALVPATAPPSVRSPLRERVFRALWVAQFTSNVGTWMQTVGVQWLLLGHGTTWVAMVQVAASLPVFLLAFPAGALADLVDRRRLLIAAQCALAVLAAALAALAFTHRAGPVQVLLVTFLLGCGTALVSPAWQAIQPSLVKPEQLRQAAGLGAVSMNLARAVGPALGGVVLSLVGVGWTFAFNAVSFTAVAVAVVRWQPARRGLEEPERERALAALRAGGRYVRHAPGVRRILLRAVLFIPAAAAVWALLPVWANSALHLGSGGYGLLLAAVGVGAVAGAGLLPRCAARLSATSALAGASVLFALCVLVMVLLPLVPVAVVALIGVGAAWIGALSTLNGALQLLLPGWVRARGLAVYLVVFQGGQAAGALLWGLLADRIGLSAAWIAGAVLMLAGAGSVIRWPLRTPPAGAEDDGQPGWPEPMLALVPQPAGGPVLVTVRYLVLPGGADEFTQAMRAVERSRRRTGATSWGLYQETAGSPRRFVETFVVSSWSEHLAQHHDRYTGVDRAFEEQARALLETAPEVTHAIAAL